MKRSLTRYLIEAFEAEVAQPVTQPAEPRRGARLPRLRRGVTAYRRLLQDLAVDPEMDADDGRVMGAIATLLGGRGRPSPAT